MRAHSLQNWCPLMLKAPCSTRRCPWRQASCPAYRELRQMFSAWITGSRWSGFTQDRLRQRWSISSGSPVSGSDPNLSVEELVGEPVGARRSSENLRLGVALAILRPGPPPAPQWVPDVDFGPEPVPCVIGRNVSVWGAPLPPLASVSAASPVGLVRVVAAGVLARPRWATLPHRCW